MKTQSFITIFNMYLLQTRLALSLFTQGLDLFSDSYSDPSQEYSQEKHKNRCHLAKFDRIAKQIDVHM